MGVNAVAVVTFRGELLRALVASGHQVLALAPEDNATVRQQLAAMGVEYRAAPIARTGLNPVRDLRTLLSLTRTMRRFRPGLAFCYGAKPVVYGSLAAWLARVPRRVAMITGIGSVLGASHGTRRRVVSTLLKTLYRVSLSRVQVVLFQNPDDERLFRDSHLTGHRQRVVRVNGSGVDLDHFAARPLPEGPMTFVMVGRLIKDKGVLEYVDAARIVRAARPECRFLLVGGTDTNPTSVSDGQVQGWVREGVIEYLGVLVDVRPALESAHVFVLPSYGEGMPRSVLEAMSVGRAIITTDVPGCRETVIEGENGHLVPPRDARALAAAMLGLAGSPERLAPMGARSRALATDRFDVHDVNRTVLRAIGLDGPTPVVGSQT